MKRRDESNRHARRAGYLSELTALRDQLKAGLSASAHESGDEAGPTVSELADKFKAIKSANTIEAAPQRVRQKHSTAEEPITARIRRRTAAIPASAPAMETDAAAPDGNSSPLSALEPNSSIKPMTFQERIAMERQRNDREPSLSQDNLHEEETQLTGEFQGVLPKARSFEFKLADNQEVVRGKVSPTITTPDEINNHLHQAITIDVLATRVGAGKPRYVLLRLPDEWSDVEQQPESGE